MVETNQRYNMGVIHGRFQVLHNDHLKYLLLYYSGNQKTKDLLEHFR